jgi:hypothetical protein
MPKDVVHIFDEQAMGRQTPSIEIPNGDTEAFHVEDV